MATVLEYVQMSAVVYARTKQNTMVVPDGWTQDRVVVDHPVTGFSAGVFVKGNEVVIGFTGTNEIVKDFLNANIPAALGLASAQVVQAAELVMDAIRTHPGASISFTGHSLGGGLASVMAVLFDRPATIFDAAPFELSARNPDTLNQLGLLLAPGWVRITSITKAAACTACADTAPSAAGMLATRKSCSNHSFVPVKPMTTSLPLT